MSSPAAVLLRQQRTRSAWRWLRGSLIARNPALARMLLAGFISTTGDRLHQMAMAALILGMTNSMVSAGLVFVVSTIPYALFALPMGALVDRWDRRKTMIGADLARGMLVVLIPLAAQISLPLVYVLLFGLTTATLAFVPARQASVPDLVEPEDLSSANSLFQAVNYMVDLLAFPIAGVLVASLVERLGTLQGTSVAFALDALSYVASAALLVRLPMVRRAASASVEPLRRLPTKVAEGMRFLRDNAQVRTNTVLLTVGPLLLGSLHTLWIGFAWRVSGSGAFGYGVVEMSNALGTLFGLLVLRWLGSRLNPGRLILVGLALMGLAIAAAGLSDSLIVVALLAALGGVGNMLFIVPSVTLVQRQTPSELRGRVFAVRLMFTYSAFSVSNAVAGGLSDVVGVSPLLLVLGLGMLLLAVSASAFSSAREAA
jgi:MFS family permease